jgi:hypothetical protein
VRTLATILAASAAMIAAPAVQAADIVAGQPVPAGYSFEIDGDIANGPVTAAYGRTGIAAGNFTDNFIFRIDQVGLGSGSISTILSGLIGSATDLDFTSVTFSNGTTTFPVEIMSSGGLEAGGLANIPVFFGALNTLSVSGLSRGAGSYGGTLAFTPGPIPEPASWAMMLIGFGAIGSIVRRRRDDNVKVRYA